jgi:calcineurin-like phosphoesterase family protein
MKLDSKKSNIWFTSDTHYWHKNITLGESVWPNKEQNCRKFNTTQEMSRHIVKQINTYVAEDDILFHLGDWSFGGINNIWNFRKQLRCQNIHLIFGNHDHHIINNKLLDSCRWISFNGVENNSFTGDKDLIVDSSSLYNGLSNRVSTQELFSSAQKYLEISIDGIKVVLFHFPIEEWNDRHKVSYHLFGHVHGRIPHGNGRLDVGIDNAYKIFKEYRPFSWKDVIKLLGKPKKQGGAGV